LVLVALPCLLGAGAFLYFDAASRSSSAASLATSSASVVGRAGRVGRAEQPLEPGGAARAVSKVDPSLDRTSAVVAAAAEAAARRYRDAASGWQQPGLCAGQTRAQVAARTAYLSSLRRYEHPSLALYADAAISAQVLNYVAMAAVRAPGQIAAAIGLEPSLPIVYVHRNVELLRANSCVGSSSVAFYDGALHLVDLSQHPGGLAEMWRSLVHELTHHALMTHGIREPIWLQEGLAMHVAGERDFLDAAIVAPGIDLREMVDGFPHTAPPEHAERFYGQAYAMVDYLGELCGRRMACGHRDMVEALRSGTSSPSALFVWAIQQYQPASRGPALRLWQAHLERRAARLQP
jgi:hypothetical protein